MATESQFPEPPPVRLELTPEQGEAVEAALPAGAAVLLVGYARRMPWPRPEAFTACAWFVTMAEAEAGLMAAGIMAKRRPKASRPKRKS